MPIDMTEAAVAKHRETATELEDYTCRNPEGEDDYIVAILYQSKHKRLFRYVESSGMDSQFAGAGNFGQWITKAERKNWNRF